MRFRNSSKGKLTEKFIILIHDFFQLFFFLYEYLSFHIFTIFLI